MKMIQKIVGLILMVSTLGSCQEISRVPCELDVLVTLEDGTPVESAKVEVGYSIGIEANPGGGFPRGIGERSQVFSDGGGKAVINFRPAGQPSATVWVNKENFYQSEYRSIRWNRPGPGSNSWRGRLTAIIKPIKNPIAMKAKVNNYALIPALDQEFGYDLEEMDLTDPYGKGKVADFFITVRGTYKNWNDANIEAVIDFKNKGDGVQQFMTEDRESGSPLLSDYEAPEKDYESKIIRNYSYQKIPKLEFIRGDDPHKNFYFKVRTQMDPLSHREISNYGKIYGDFILRAPNAHQAKGVASINFDVIYFNPSRDNRNVEFDLNKNLLKAENENVQHP